MLMDQPQKISGKITILMPTYNEAAHIFQNICETRDCFLQMAAQHEIIVIDDCSTDETFAEAMRATQWKNIRVIRNLMNFGKGYSLKRGYLQIEATDYVVFLDADLDLPPQQIARFFEVMAAEKADVVIGSKRHPDSKVNYPDSRVIMSEIYSKILKVLFHLPVRDTQVGLKLFKFQALKGVFEKILCKRFAFDIELLANIQKAGYQIAEAPIQLDLKRNRLLLWSPIAIKTVYEILLDTLAIFYRMYFLKYYDREILFAREKPKVSIIIPLPRYNAFIEETVKYCRGLNYPDYEILILPDALEEAFQKWSADPLIKVIPTGPIGPAHKRDMGLAQAAGEYIAFLDDDAYPTEEWLASALKCFQNETIAAVVGPAVTPPDDNLFQQTSGLVYSSYLSGGRYSYRYSPKNRMEVDDYPSCNFIVRRKDAIAINGFNTPYWPGEDTFFCLKLTRDLGKRILYDPDVLVFHHRRELFKPHLNQIKNYALHRGYFAKRFPETSLKMSYFIPSLFVLFVLLGIPLSLMVPEFFGAYVAILILYGGLLLIEGVRTLNLKRGVLRMAGIAATHLYYGIYFVIGLLTRRLKEEGRP